MLAALPPGTTEDFEITTLDRLGLPVWASSWYPETSPGQRAFASPGGGNGFGATRSAARLSSLGEMSEWVHVSTHVRASRPVTGSYADLVAERGEDAVLDPRRLPLDAGGPWTPDLPLRWLPARRWGHDGPGEEVLVPAEAVAVDGDDVPGGPPPHGWLVTPITNGLGAGDRIERAVAHALLELLQRDGNGLRYRALDDGAVLDLDALADPVAQEVLATLDDAGVEVLVKLASLDMGVVNVFAVGAERPGVEPPHPLMVTAAGEGTHPDRDVAVRKALLEFAAARTRRAWAHGPLDAVDAVAPPGYRARWEAHHPGAGEPRTLEATRRWARLDSADLRALVADPVLTTRSRHPLAGLPAAPHLAADWSALLHDLLERLGREGLTPLVVRCGSDDVPVCKVLVPGLEVETLSYGRIGARNARRLLDRAAAGDERVSGLVGRDADGAPPADAARIHLLPADESALGGPLWFSRARAADVVGPLFALYREPGRHLAAR